MWREGGRSGALRIRHMKFCFGRKSGFSGSNGASPCASANARSQGIESPSATSVASSASAVKPFTGKRYRYSMRMTRPP